LTELSSIEEKKSDNTVSTVIANTSNSIAEKYLDMLVWAKDKIVPTISTVLPPSIVESVLPISQPVSNKHVMSKAHIKYVIESFAEDISSFRIAYRMDCAINEINSSVVSQAEDEAKAANAQAVQRVLEEFRDDISLFGKQFYTSIEKNHSNWKELLGVKLVHHKSTNQFAWVDKKAEAKYTSYLNKMARSGDIDNNKLTSLRITKNGAMSREVNRNDSYNGKSFSREHSPSAFPVDVTTSAGSTGSANVISNAPCRISSDFGPSDIAPSAAIKLELLQQTLSKQHKAKDKKYSSSSSNQKMHSGVDGEVYYDNEIDNESSYTLTPVIKQKDQEDNLTSSGILGTLHQPSYEDTKEEERGTDNEQNAMSTNNPTENSLVPLKDTKSKCEIM
jgi:hypothetical protein